MTLPPEISGEYATIRLFAHAKVINPPLTEPCKKQARAARQAPESSRCNRALTSAESVDFLFASRLVGVLRPVITRG